MMAMTTTTADSDVRFMGLEGSRGRIVAILVVLLIGSGLRVWNLSSQSFSMDEMYELRAARQTIPQIVAATDGFPPLYCVALHYWMRVFPSDVSARWLSALLGVVSILAVWRTGCWVGGAAHGLWAALFIALCPFHIYFSQEARAYSLYFLASACALWAFLRAQQCDRALDWTFFAAACVAGAYTHYYFAILLLMMTAALMLRRRSRACSRGDLAALAAIAVLSLPCLWLLRGDLGRQMGYPTQSPFSVAAIGYTYFSFMSGFTLGPSLRELHSFSTGQAVVSVLPWVTVIGLAAAPLGYAGWLALKRRHCIAPIMMLLVCPVLIVGLLAGFANVGYKVRYVIWVAIPLVLWLSAGLARPASRWPARIGAALLLVTSV
jgi:uncharacterized membrane protein